MRKKAVTVKSAVPVYHQFGRNDGTDRIISGNRKSPKTKRLWAVHSMQFSLATFCLFVRPKIGFVFRIRFDVNYL